MTPPQRVRPHSDRALHAIAIGGSTGGPHALAQVLSEIKGAITVPVFITQHMPASFTPILAEQLGRFSGHRCKEGRDGESVDPGTIYLAPGGYHMVIEKNNGRIIIRITSDPPENFCRPAVDPMLRSLSAVYKSHLLAVILTGMGQDGALGCRSVIAEGGRVLAQDQNSSVVWGMPGAVVRDGSASEILPPEKIGIYLLNALKGLV